MKQFKIIRQFDRAEMLELMQQYEYAKPSPTIEKHGYLTKDQFLEIAIWKTERPRKRYFSNSSDFVEAATKASFSTNCEEFRIESLRLLNGVDFPVASTILHFGFDATQYPIIDFRALWSLYGIDRGKISYNFAFWNNYRNHCLNLANDLGMTIRELDKALWQYSKRFQID